MTNAVVTVSAFHTMLRQEREARGFSMNVLSKLVSVPEGVIRQWEDGEALPTRSQYGKVCRQIRAMRRYPPLTFASVRRRPVDAGECAEDRSLVVVAGAVEEPATFGRALRHEREQEGMDQDELGALLDVTGQAVSAWETGRTSPVRPNYEALLTLFPALREAPEPDWRNMDVPDGGRGVPREGPPSHPEAVKDPGQATPQTPAPSLDPVPVPREAAPDSPPTARVDLVEQLLGAYNEVHPGRWEARVALDGAAPHLRWSVDMVKNGGAPGRETAHGESVADCCLSLLARLDGELTRRISELQALRAAVRDAGARSR